VRAVALPASARLYKGRGPVIAPNVILSRAGDSEPLPGSGAGRAAVVSVRAGRWGSAPFRNQLIAKHPEGLLQRRGLLSVLRGAARGIPNTRSRSASTLSAASPRVLAAALRYKKYAIAIRLKITTTISGMYIH
jgi:hypothetical protein